MSNYSIAGNRKEKIKKLKEKRKACGMMADCRTGALKVPDGSISAGV